MLKNLTRTRLIQIWFALVVTLAAFSAAFGSPPSLGTATALIGLSLVPAGIIMMLWPGLQTPTAAEVIRGER